ncbi:MAG: hypothetical protein JWP26_1468 [Devosia sp.]|uniref:hypothetical protein n=1 Tax=Devosia sp. TaxID=1871048 RepID=UPI00261832D9|nr:hypothetical protein [Devosia sp.]MDB5586498.1 hypothetical protein [Devosia sp.]
MTAFSNSRFIQSGLARVVTWMGRSGRVYGLVGENLDRFAMTENDLYLIAKGGNALWVGSTHDLVGDPLSRSRFRLALDCADRVFRLVTPSADSERLSTIWDLEGAEPVQERSAA